MYFIPLFQKFSGLSLTYLTCPLQIQRRVYIQLKQDTSTSQTLTRLGSTLCLTEKSARLEGLLAVGTALAESRLPPKPPAPTTYPASCVYATFSPLSSNVSTAHKLLFYLSVCKKLYLLGTAYCFENFYE